MAVASVPTRERFGVPSSPTAVNTNFQTLVNFLNQNIVHRDGTVAFTSAQDMSDWKITNLGAATLSTDGASKAVLDAAIAARWDDDKGQVTLPVLTAYSWTGAATYSTGTITFTAVAGRRYRASLVIPIGITNRPSFIQIKDGSTTLKTVQVNHPTGKHHVLCIDYVTTASISGSKTWNVVEPFSGGPTTTICTGSFSIEDVGAL